jgi:hypothetical protein
MVQSSHDYLIPVYPTVLGNVNRTQVARLIKWLGRSDSGVNDVSTNPNNVGFALGPHES